jgi:hypothetical protein
MSGMRAQILLFLFFYFSSLFLWGRKWVVRIAEIAEGMLRSAERERLGYADG